MADVKKIATRESYGNTLKELAAEGHDDLVVLDADLAAATKTGMFRKAYPDRHFDCGIAEGNMRGVAAGLSTMGYVPFVSSFAMFAAGRAFEQVRNSIGYPHLNVKIGATHGGISVGEDGAISHGVSRIRAYIQRDASVPYSMPRRYTTTSNPETRPMTMPAAAIFHFKWSNRGISRRISCAASLPVKPGNSLQTVSRPAN